MKKLLFFICLLSATIANAQQWGLYTLYGVQGTNHVYLVDTNGVIFKTWTFPLSQKTCFSNYLTRGDTLVRSVIYPGMVITGGPISGETQKVDWNNNVTWDFIYSDSLYVSHHDICPMPNGNVLLISYDIKTDSEAVQAGSSNNITRYSEKIIEVHQTGPTTGTIVWEWDLWDHLCQNFDATKANYVSSLAQNPQLININYLPGFDFMHLNGLDYNPVLDQIAFSSLKYSEIYVIDHSTKTAQAKGHTGGNSGKGGDILYRWGNPATYGAAGTADFSSAHDVRWISADNIYYPNYLIGFNNNGGTGGNKSCVDIFNPPYDGYIYSGTPGTAYGPATYTWRYNSSLWSAFEGGAQALPNGNVLACFSFRDTLLEVDHSGNILWAYDAGGTVAMANRYSKCYVRGPVATSGASATLIMNGDSTTLSVATTSVTETNPSYTYSWWSVPAGFTSSMQNPHVTPTSNTTYYVVVTDTALGCSDTASVSVRVTGAGINELTNNKPPVVVYPNPTTGIVNLSGNLLNDHDCRITVSNASGQTVMKVQECATLDFTGMPRGVYYLTVETGASEVLHYKVVY